MAIIKVRDENGDVIDIPAFVGPKGDPGADYVLTESDKAEIAAQAAELVEVPEGGTATIRPLTFTGAVNATYDGSEAVSVEIPQGGVDITIDKTLSVDGAAADAKAVGDAMANVGKPTDEQVANAVKRYLAENPAQGNVYYNKLSMTYTVTEEDVANYTAGDKFVVKLSGFNGFIKSLCMRVAHPYATGGSVINVCDIICPDPKNTMNHYRSGKLLRDKTVGAWHDRAVYLNFAKSSGQMLCGGVENFSGTASAITWGGNYWFDPSIVPIDSLGIHLVFETLVAGLVIELHATEEVAY